MAYYETHYQELLKLTKELMTASAYSALLMAKAEDRLGNISPEISESIHTHLNGPLQEIHLGIFKFMELEVKGFEDTDCHFGKKLAPRVGKLQLIFETLSEIQRNMLIGSQDPAEDRLLDQLEMDNMRWCEEISSLLKEWYNRRTKID